MFIAVDDTDSRTGMCTTFLATELIREFKEYRLLDYPRLVRLNPNVPWKTRGNGAVVIELGKGNKKEKTIGSIDKDIETYRGKQVNEQEQIFKRAKKVVEKWAEFESEGTDPGLVVGSKRPPRELYERAVKDVVPMDEVLDILNDNDYLFEGYKERRGLIGATAALAWTPEDHTYELITYRKQSNWGTDRNIPKEDVKRLDKELKQAFDSYDHQENSSTIDPNSPCPVLYGVRGDEPEELKRSLDIISGEKPERWITFLTNQGTDDHIQQAELSELKPWISVKTSGRVTKEPRTIEGGHVLFEISDNSSTITAAAYEPTKNFREVINRLIKGDELEVWGGVRKDPLTINLEKIRITHLEQKEIKTGNPVCPECGRRMGSIGKDAGFRCKRCSTKADEDDIETKLVDRKLEKMYYETPVSARRHLSKPIKRI